MPSHGGISTTSPIHGTGKKKKKKKEKMSGHMTRSEELDALKQKLDAALGENIGKLLPPSQKRKTPKFPDKNPPLTDPGKMHPANAENRRSGAMETIDQLKALLAETETIDEKEDILELAVKVGQLIKGVPALFGKDDDKEKAMELMKRIQAMTEDMVKKMGG